MGEGNEGGTALAIGGGSAGLGVSCLGTVRVLVLLLAVAWVAIGLCGIRASEKRLAVRAGRVRDDYLPVFGARRRLVGEVRYQSRIRSRDEANSVIELLGSNVATY